MLPPRQNSSLPAAVFPERFYSLDVMRGVAALSVAVFHWGHFYFDGQPGNLAMDSPDRPFFPWLKILYEHGELAVDFFFVLSGFMFYWLYSQPIANRTIGVKAFTALRFSRLYPLHLATLLLVALLQWGYYHQNGRFFVYPFNDIRHLLLQLGFASQWGFEAGHSFNGPVWSVSIEILLYLFFFAVCWVRGVKLWQCVALCAVGLALHTLNRPLGRGVFGFYLGGTTYFAARCLVARGIGLRGIALAVVTATTGWIAVTASSGLSLPHRVTVWVQSLDIAGLSDSLVAKMIGLMMEKSAVVILFPIAMIVCVLIEVRRGSLGRRISFLGDISYSSYLLHFPLQLVVIIAFTHWNWNANLLRSNWSLVAFYAVLVPASVLVFHFYERPAQAFIRKHFQLGAQKKRT